MAKFAVQIYRERVTDLRVDGECEESVLCIKGEVVVGLVYIP